MRLWFWILVGLVVYCYIGYPLLIALAARIRGRPVRRAGGPLPSVSVVISAWNEAEAIGRRIENLLAQDYPAGGLEILVGSDGSTDGTAAVLEAIRDPRLRVFRFDRRRGKPAVFNDLVPRAKGAVVVFTDARQRFAPDTIRRLAENFADPEVGCVSGTLFFESTDASAAKGVGLYWNYELFIRRREALVHSMLGATGAVYAVRRDLIPRIPESIVLDDMFIPLTIVLKGLRAVMDERAGAFDRPAASGREEYRRKVRTLYGNYQLLAAMPEVLIPGRSPVALQMLSHKCLRLVMPLILPVVFGLSVLGSADPFLRGMSVLQTIFYGAAAVGGLSRASKCGRLRRLTRWCGVPAMFCVMNAAAAAGLYRFLLGRQPVTWEKAGGAAGSEREEG